ncbi:hypothetical protein [Listeria grayi]|uniref:Uncharacterized protein n=1 Tax=Listeria grayi DSM 20601 TaxID=525367 RepID=D7UXS2_LISGR|nr:hypothetical protein [Listeria grayi]EFI84480.1 hypothetical protein HMPREF0556_11033 [Listeria grayi DSM 20601]
MIQAIHNLLFSKYIRALWRAALKKRFSRLSFIMKKQRRHSHVKKTALWINALDRKEEVFMKKFGMLGITLLVCISLMGCSLGSESPKKKGETKTVEVSKKV